ncbi:MAG: sigma-E factor negative regulatory protein [Proteobacteria bacterium]|nr:sigma-E factor negative regulatory protein [Pseudomonadota bacterium]
MSTEERESQLSALLDGELEAGQAELVTRRLLKDPALQATWGRYALIGAVLRKEPLLDGGRGTNDVAARVRLRMAGEAALHAIVPAPVPAVAARKGGLGRVAGGVALAASVALAVVGALRLQMPFAPPVQQVAAIAAAAPAPVAVTPPPAESARSVAAGSDSALPSYTTPRDTRSAVARLGAPLVNYVVAHSEATAPAVRMSPLSALMSDALDPADNTVEMTEAEIGARR